MKRGIVLALFAALASLLLIGCSTLDSEPVEESAPVGASVRILGTEGSYVDAYYELTSPLSLDWMVPAGTECEVLSGPRSMEGITFWQVSCTWGNTIESQDAPGWIDVASIEVLE